LAIRVNAGVGRVSAGEETIEWGERVLPASKFVYAKKKPKAMEVRE